MEFSPDRKFWAIRAGKGGAAHKIFFDMNVIALEDAELGNLTKLTASREEFYSVYRKLHPDETRTGTAGVAGKFFRFIHEVNVGDYVVYPALIDKKYYVGEITSEYKFVNQSEFPHQRTVTWNYAIDKQLVSKRAQQELNAARTFFEFKNNINNLIDMMTNEFRIT